MCPFQSDQSRMNTMCLCDRLHLRNLQIRNILRADISLRSAWRTDWHIAYRLDVMLYQIIIKLLLLEAYMKLKLTGCRFDLHKRKNCLKLRNGHIGNTDVTDLSFFYQRLTLAVCIHKLLHTEGFGIRISGFHITSRCMIVREWPMDEIHIHIIALKILNALVAGFLYSSVHVVPYLCHDKKILTLYNTFVKSVLKYLADLMLVSVACGTVKHTVATADCTCNSCRYILCGYTVGTECSHSDTRNLLAGRKCHFRHNCRIDNFCHLYISFFIKIFLL